MVKVPVRLVSWDEIVKWSWGLAKKIRQAGYNPGVIIAIARGGYVPARLLCDFLGIENLISIQSQHWTEAAKKSERAIIKFEYKVNLENMKALLVDDIIDTGESVILARDYIIREWKPKELKIAALQWISPVAKIKPDFYYLEVKEWVWFQYPWTRLEDVTQFLKRMLTEESKNKKEWKYIEIIRKFIEWYGIEVDEEYYKEALRTLIEKGLLEKRDEIFIVKV
ncbi:MAG: phosphoribosyltransferase [Thermoprotei archaeon]|nr:MAG: phosphoribosyltransferase [Thermoprotei archaeon]